MRATDFTKSLCHRYRFPLLLDAYRDGVLQELPVVIYFHEKKGWAYLTATFGFCGEDPAYEGPRMAEMVVFFEHCDGNVEIIHVRTVGRGFSLDTATKAQRRLKKELNKRSASPFDYEKFWEFRSQFTAVG